MTEPISRTAALAVYRKRRDEYLRLAALADAAWDRWFTKRKNGEPTNGAAASRAASVANYASADLAGAQLALYHFEIDPADVDREDGVERTVTY